MAQQRPAGAQTPIAEFPHVSNPAPANFQEKAVQTQIDFRWREGRHPRSPL